MKDVRCKGHKWWQIRIRWREADLKPQDGGRIRSWIEVSLPDVLPNTTWEYANYLSGQRVLQTIVPDPSARWSHTRLEEARSSSSRYHGR
jgi:hypothetical protein